MDAMSLQIGMPFAAAFRGWMSCGQSFDSLAAKETWMWIDFKLPEKVKLINGEKQEHHRLQRFLGSCVEGQLGVRRGCMRV